MIWRDIKTRFAQSVLGIGWAVIQPLFSMIVFTVVFGKLARISSDGVPYAIFSYTALVPWTYFSNALSSSTGSLITASGIMTKVYFPRLIIPLSPVLSKLIDFVIAFLILIGGASSSDCIFTAPPFEDARPLAQASLITFVINRIDLIASSFPGII